MPSVFIDGQAGTTGLQIAEQLQNREDIELVMISHERRKDTTAKQKLLNEVDLVILCLPDAAAMESVEMIRNETVRVLDASTAHRTNPGWVYGMPELAPEQRDSIIAATRVANPGCYPTGFLLGIVPLIRAGVVPRDYPVFIDAVSGYSGGGRQLVEKYQARQQLGDGLPWTYRKYGLQLAHKHVPEMLYYSGLEQNPIFVPAVADFYKGMLVSMPLAVRLLKPGTTPEHIRDCLAQAYRSEPFVNVCPLNDFDQLDAGFLSPVLCNDTNRVDIMLYADNDQAVIISRLDNLGKGASGAAVQNMNLMLGVNENTGLTTYQPETREKKP